MKVLQPLIVIFSTLYSHRRYIWGNALHELKYRFAGTALGIFWNIFQPLMELTVYTIIFSWLFPRTVKGMPFIVYLSSGLLVWRSFASCLIRGCNIYREKSQLIKQTTFPPEIHIADVCVASLLVSFIYYLLLTPLVYFFGAQLSPALFLLPVMLFFFQIMAFAFNLILSPLCILIPDIREIIQTMMPLWFWTLPIIYPETILPLHWRNALYLNPPYAIIKSVQDIILNQTAPSFNTWLAVLGWLSVLLVIGTSIHTKLQYEVREIL